MAILVPGWLDLRWQVRLQMCLKFYMAKVANCTGSPNEHYHKFLPPQEEAVKVEYLLRRVGPRPIPGLDSFFLWG